MSVAVKVYNGPLDGVARAVVLDTHLDSVCLPVRVWYPLRCPDCGGTGPFRALARWHPVLVDGYGGVVEVLDEPTWADLSDGGPGLQCPCGGREFYPLATVEPSA